MWFIARGSMGVYVNKDALYTHPAVTGILCREIAKRFRVGVEVVAAPAIGGVILAQWTAFHLAKLSEREVLAVYAEKSEDGKSFLFKRGYEKLLKNARTLVLEDVLTTGRSVRRVVDVAKQAGAMVVGVGALWNRGGVTPQSLNVNRLESLMDIRFESWEEKDCQLCVKKIPINLELGHGAEYIKRFPSF
ncbi:MAG TPA: phosphoribosyltransferase family protein [Patescibacteria group bacterium]|nr:phosphoribosyltransferase family protein [Patescibacteria group bacterium]